GIMYSANYGDTWNQSSYYGKTKTVNSLISSGNKIFAGTTATGIYVSSDNGINWQMSYPVETVWSLAAGSNLIIAGCQTNPGSGGVLLTTNSGLNWTQAGLLGTYVTSLAVSGTNLVAGTYSNGIYITTNNGANWNNTLTGFGTILSLAANDNFVLAGTNGYGILISTNSGLNWSQSSITNDNIRSLKVNGSVFYAGTANNGIQVTTNNGANFTRYDFSKEISSITFSGNTIFAGTVFDGIYKTTNNGANWTKTQYNNLKTVSLCSDNRIIFTGAYNNGLSFSTDGGVNWIQSELTTQHVNSVAINDNIIFAGMESVCSGIGMMRSTNGGINWHEAGFYYDVFVTSMIMSGNKLLIGSQTCVDYGGIYLSTDNGNTFTNTLSGQDVISIYANGSNVYAGMVVNFSGTNGGINVSSDGGYNWQYIGPGGKSINAVTVNGNYIFAGTGTGVWVTTNNGTNWTQTTLTSKVYALLSTGNYLFAGTEANGVYFSSNNGSSWTQKNQGLVNNQYVSKIVLQNNKLYASTYGNSVFQRDLAEIVSVNNISTEIPSGYSLSQNYPNPFNPITNIKFSIINSGNVKLIVYNIMGKEVQSLVNERLQPGVYDAVFDGANLNSGVYFYKLVTDSYSETKKMLLVK
ncbi:MAG: T9SS type A sorting domain-containing protein, partial [Ignavibacteria bacterium]